MGLAGAVRLVGDLAVVVGTDLPSSEAESLILPRNRFALFIVT